MNWNSIKKWQYYIIILVISLMALFLMPMIGSEAGLKWQLPDTISGWIVYIITKIMMAVINLLIFHCFILQGKQNISEDPKYLEALKILASDENNSDSKPRSPGEWKRTTYGKKAITLFIASLLSAIGLTQAVLTFDIISMLTYFITITLSLIFGILQMNETERYWTIEFYNYAQLLRKEENNDCS